MTQEALKHVLYLLNKPDTARQSENVRLAEDFIKEALAQPKQEPFAYVNVEKRRLEFASPYVKWDTPTTIKLDKIPLYTTPPQREPLTDKAITRVIDRMPKKMKGFMVDWDLYIFTRAIEAAHNIKENT